MESTPPDDDDVVGGGDDDDEDDDDDDDDDVPVARGSTIPTVLVLTWYDRLEVSYCLKVPAAVRTYRDTAW